jgi:hypothetical protein
MHPTGATAGTTTPAITSGFEASNQLTALRVAKAARVVDAIYPNFPQVRVVFISAFLNLWHLHLPSLFSVKPSSILV